MEFLLDMASDSERNNISNSEDMEVDLENMGCDIDEEGGLKIDDDIYIPPPPMILREADTNGPRLMICKIVNENFKSYAGVQVVGPFHKVDMNYIRVVFVHICFLSIIKYKFN